MDSPLEESRNDLPLENLYLTEEELLLIEKLVDNELNGTDRHKLFARLDEVPNGWKTCAISFLESQAFRSALKSVNSSLVVSSAENNPLSSPMMSGFLSVHKKRTSSTKRYVQLRLATLCVSAVIVLTCSAPFFKQSFFPDTDKFVQNQPASHNHFPLENKNKDDVLDLYPDLALAPIGSMSADNDVRSKSKSKSLTKGVPTLALSADDKVTKNNEKGAKNLPRFRKEDSLLAYGGALREEPSGKLGQSSLSENLTPIRTVTLNCPQYGFINVPASCEEKEHYDPEILQVSRRELPEEVVKQLKQEGVQVNARRDEYRFDLGDGRVLILPVDSYDIQYNNRPMW